MHRTTRSQLRENFRTVSGKASLVLSISAFVLAGVIGWRVLSSSEATAAVMEGSGSHGMLILSVSALSLCIAGYAFALRAFTMGPSRVRRWTSVTTTLLGVPGSTVSMVAFVILL